ncbi:MAG: polysaccharide deacetylase family protein, partial [Burkholderiaceae bacterium]
MTSPSRRPPLIHASIGLHVFAAGMMTVQPSWWPMTLATLVADHAVITATGLWPTSTWLGPNLRRLPVAATARGEIALTIDDGPDPDVTPRVLDLLDALAVRATFFCIGARIRAHPALARAIVARGHAIENHSDIHRHDFSLLGPARLDRELASAQRTIVDTVGIAPRFFRAPAGLRNVFLQAALERQDLALTSWTRRGFDTVGRDPKRVAARLVAGLAAGDILLLHDGHA